MFVKEIDFWFFDDDFSFLETQVGKKYVVVGFKNFHVKKKRNVLIEKNFTFPETRTGREYLVCG